MKNREPRPPRRTPHWLRRGDSSPDNRASYEGPASGSFTPRDNPKLTRPVRDEQPPRLALAPVIDETINVMNEREEQRHKLINTLIVVQLLITAAVSFGYHDKPGFIFPVMLATLGVYLIALIAGYLLRNDRFAAYILVFGGGLAVTAQVVAATFAGNPEETGHVALFFLAVMIEAGLLLTPELTVIVVTAALALTGALLLLIAINNDVSGPQIYLVVLYTLSPMALAGIVSWLLSHYIFVTAVTAQHAQDLEFKQAHFQQMKTHERERQEQLNTSIGAIQTAIGQAITGDYTVRVPVSDGDLQVVENSLNLLLDTFDSMVQAQQENARMTGAMLPITEGLNRLNDTVTPVHTIKTDTPFDNLSAMATRLADSYNRRLARMQEQLVRVSAGVAHSRDGLANASEEFVAAKRQAGVLISRADAVQATLRKQLELLSQARRMLATLLPPEITQSAESSEGGDPSLRGLGIGNEPGFTREFESLAPTTPAEAGIAPLTMPLPAVSLDQSDDGAQNAAEAVAAADEAGKPNGAHGARGAKAANSANRVSDVNGVNGVNSANGVNSMAGKGLASGDELPAELVEVWHLLLQIGEELNQQERAIASFTQDLGILSKTVRNADTGIAWTLTALDTIQKSSDTAQSSAQHPIPDGMEGAPADGQESGGFNLRPAGHSRPLWPGSQAPDNADRPPPRGSLNASDLLGGADEGARGGDAAQDGASPEG